MPDQIRLLVVEDVPQVAQYIRGLLNTQSTIKLLDVVSDGTRVPRLLAELRPDVLLIDGLLQGRVKGLSLVQQLHASGSRVPVIVLTVPQQPVQVNPDELAAHAAAAGLEVEALAGDYDLTPLAPGAERVVLVARRR